MHSEMPGPGGVHTLQLWLNLPARLKRVKARYQNVFGADAPALREGGVEARLYAGQLGDLAAPFATAWPMTLIDLKLKPGAAFAAPAPSGQRAFALVLDGEAALGADRRAAKAGDIAWAAVSPGRRRVRRAAGHGGRRFGPRSRVREPDHRRAGGDGRAVRHEHAGGDSRGLRRPSGGTADRRLSQRRSSS